MSGHFKRLFLTIFILGFMFATVSRAFAGNFMVVRPLSYGTIVANPAGADLILDAKTGDVLPEALIPGSISSTGGHCAILLFSGFGEQELTIQIENTVDLTSPSGTLKIYDIQKYSENDPTASGNPEELRIGGRLNIPAGYKSGSYSGIIHVTLTVN